jgi:hypothetical protein
LDLFLLKTCLLAEFVSHLRKIISLSYELFFLLKLGRLIGFRVRNPKQLSLHQMDFSNSRYSSRNGWKSILTKHEICLWRLRFPCSFFFYFSCHICMEKYGYYLSNATRITLFLPLKLKLYTKYWSKVKFVNVWHGWNMVWIVSNLLLFESYIQKCL